MQKMLQAVILAGGLGTRLRPLTERFPKPMVEVAGKPFLEWQLLDLKSQGIERVLLLVGYLSEQIRDYFAAGEKWGLRIEYSVEAKPLGTGGALSNARPLLENSFFLLNGDSFLRAPLAKMQKSFSSEPHCQALLSCYRGETPVPFNLKLEPSSHSVLQYEKGAGLQRGFTAVDSGLYVLRDTILDGRKVGTGAYENFQLEELWPELIEKKQIQFMEVKERFYDIGDLERLKKFEEKVRDYFPNTV